MAGNLHAAADELYQVAQAMGSSHTAESVIVHRDGAVTVFPVVIDNKPLHTLMAWSNLIDDDVATWDTRILYRVAGEGAVAFRVSGWTGERTLTVEVLVEGRIPKIAEMNRTGHLVEVDRNAVAREMSRARA